ncbi:hypothetical protein D3C76_656110 [compost metagenome]
MNPTFKALFSFNYPYRDSIYKKHKIRKPGTSVKLSHSHATRRVLDDLGSLLELLVNLLTYFRFRCHDADPCDPGSVEMEL